MPRTIRRASTATAEAPVEETTTEEAPARRGTRRARQEEGFKAGAEEGTAKAKPSVSKGWGAVEKEKAANSDYAQNFKPTEDEVVIKFLDAEPFAVYRQHWIEKPGKKSYSCLESIGKDCPLCDDLGDRPRSLSVFNVIDFTDPDSPEVKVWETGSRIITTLQNFSKKEKTSPLNRDDLYFSVSRSGKGTKSTTSITAIKVRDLADDYDIEPLDAAALEEFDEKAYDESTIYFNTEAQLEEVVDEVGD